MRTTLVIDDAVIAAARRRALDTDVTLSELVTEALREHLAADVTPPPPFRMLSWGGREAGATVTPAQMKAALDDDDAPPARPR